MPKRGENLNVEATTKPALLTGISARLVADSIITTEQAQTAIREASKKQVSLISYLSQALDIDSYDLAEIASAEFGVPLLDLSAIDRSTFPDKLVSAALMSKHQTIPIFRRGNRLFIALADPTNIAALDEIKFATGISTEAVVVDERVLARLLTELLDQQNSLNSEMGQLKDSTEFDLDIFYLRGKQNFRLKNFGIIAIQYESGRASSKSNESPLRPSSFDRSYNYSELYIPMVKNKNLILVDELGISYRLENRKYDAEDFNDPLHSGRSHQDSKYDAWMKKQIFEDMKVKLAFRMRDRSTFSSYNWVSDLKSFNQLQTWISIEWKIDYDKY